ncbi:MAG: zincin-like metallopeptidase domain-containing protein [Cyanobacteria bacterium]|nr:zincin-like metallopeptidase domain-containing protein [Cyanobacteriota bacterium]
MAASQSRSRKSFDGPTAEEKIVASLIELMEAGSAPWRRPWDGTGGGHHVNLISGHRYRGANPILLTLGMHIRGSALPFWCGFAEAKKLGIFPRKGSKAVHILRPQLHSREEPGVGGEVTLRSWASYRPVAVFNAADLEGEALPVLIEARKAAEGVELKPEPERLEVAEAVLGAWPVPVSFGGDRACYLPAIDRIQLPDRASFHSPAAFCATWAHEQIHSTGHESRLKRDLGGAFGKPRYAREELVAELGEVLLGDRLEIGSEIESHAAYLGHWVELLKESPRVLFQMLSEARQAADLICPEAPMQLELQGEAHLG